MISIILKIFLWLIIGLLSLILIVLCYPIFYKVRIKTEALSTEKTDFAVKVRFLSLFAVLEIRKKDDKIESFLRLFGWRVKNFSDTAPDRESELEKRTGKDLKKSKESVASNLKEITEEEKPSTEPKEEEIEDQECFFFRIFHKVKQKVLSLMEKAKALKTKKERFQKLYETESCKRTITEIRRKLPKILKHLLPKKAVGSLQMGLESCDRTGMVFGYYSVVSSWFPHQIQLHPDFENEIFQGELALKGRIVLMYLLYEALGFLLNKDFRITYRRFNKIMGGKR